MILRKEQIDALYSLNAAKRNGLKSAFHHWPMGIVPFEIDPTFRKDFAFSFHFFFSSLPHSFIHLFILSFPLCCVYVYLGFLFFACLILQLCLWCIPMENKSMKM
jgi:hypothetical protein